MGDSKRPMKTVLNERDREFIAALYAAYFDTMKKQAIKILKSEMQAEDIVQDTIVKSMYKVSTLHMLDEKALIAYITVAVKRNCYNYLKRNSVRCEKIVEDLEMLQISSLLNCCNSVEEEVINKIQFKVLLAVIEKLPAKYKNVLYYKYLYGLKDGEIAKLLGIKKESVRQYLTLARRATLLQYNLQVK